MSFHCDELDAIEAWIPTAKALSGIYYRSVEYRFMDPKEVLNGRGAAVYGGRFASVGTRAVFLAESDSAASEEVLARKRRLGGSAQLTLDKYPRIVFGVAVSRASLGPLQEEFAQDVAVRSGRVPRPRRSHSVDGSWRPVAQAVRPGTHLSQRRWSGEELFRDWSALAASGFVGEQNC